MHHERPRRAVAWLASLAAVVLVLGISAAVSPGLPWPPVVGYAAAFALVCASALAVAAAAPLWTWPEVAGVVVVGLGIVLATPVDTGGWVPAACLSVGLLSAATVLGAGLGARIDRPGHLAAVAAISSLADLWSVFDPAAPSARLAASIEAAGPGVLSPWVLAWPMPGTPSIDPMLGVGDVVFMGLYLGAARAHELSRRRMVGLLALACGGALAMVVTLARPLPLLPAFGLCVIAGEPAARRLQAREWRLLTAVSASVLVLLLARSA